MAQDRFKPLLDRDFLKAELHYEFRDFLENGQDDILKTRVADWHKRAEKKETKAEASFIQRFFVETWGYREDGTGADSFHLKPKFAIAGAGQTGNRGEADLAIGHFGGIRPEIPQVVCEFKDVKSGLDKPQNRKGNNRSPVQQAKDYLWNARRGLFGNEPVQPRFAIVTDMNEFRLYWWDHFPDRYLRFKIDGGDLFNPATLLGDNDDSAFDRFLFWRLFQPNMLLSDAGRTRLERLIQKQGKAEEKLEGDFYQHYRGYREVLIDQIMLQRPEGMTRGGAVRLGQKLLDRLIFVMFAEDMGGRVGFPSGALQDQLKTFSQDSLLEANGDEVWRRLKLIFRIMNSGGPLGEVTIHRFNGGLFAQDDAIDGLDLPNHIFVRYGQGLNDAKLAEHKQTLFFLSATYNFAREGDAKNSIGLYTLGHIFEQSIVELEKLEADAEGRTSLTDVTKRKRDGVYYTPEWAVRRIIEETVDPLFAAWKAEAGWPTAGDPSREAAASYWKRLQNIRILDPACGSGAFLIVALKHLEGEFAAAAAIARQTGAIERLPVEDEITSQILANNLFGVDINPASVEITKLSLWLHTAMPNKPLSGLDDNIQCGNSLVDKRFYNKRDILDADERDRINTFEWEGDFALGSFDAVIGNPPYVKFQNFVKVHADMAAWMVSGSSGAGPYVSTVTGNFDLYLPFIEKGLALLNDGGRMGYIAPNLWPTLVYGAGLRALVHGGRHLEKWLDFRSHQVFEEATVYTAIQIFSKAPVDAIQLAFAPDGDVSRVDWSDASHRLPYADIPDALASDPWLLAPMAVRAMVARLDREALRLDQPENVKAIFQGIITGADHIFHLQRLGRDRYSYVPRHGGKKLAPVVVDIEDAVMKPLVSGAEAKRFIEPRTDTFLLFPYAVDASGARLLSAEAMADRFPKAWAYLQTFEAELRAREGGKFDDDGWYRMGRNQNLDKQEVPKLLVAQLVPHLRLTFDDGGKFYINNVRVNGILPQSGNGWYLLGALNSPTINFVFKWLGKPKDNGYFEANKQFIAPLPIPKPGRADRAGLSALAKGMQERRTMQVDKRARLEERLAATARENWPLEKLLPDVRPVDAITEATPESVPASERKAWVDAERAAEEEAALARIDGIIRLDSEFAVILADGKLALTIDEQEAARVYVTEAEAALVEAQWRCIAIDTQPTGKGDAKRLIQRLRRVATRAEPAVAEQIIAIGKELAALDGVIRDDEAQLHEMTCALFNLSAEERALVEGKRG
ncbi:Eco57I restriction-modification methylase domain-containing protein [Sphingopyxis sp.]|uniref:Eco57I restriction-modification methylase domain-containing protein n=1 Tax=Sphingopyxis sp. TaxID=1908224 RepID=UPI003D146179